MSNRESLLGYTFAHFCIDFACFFMLFQGVGRYAGDLNTLTLGFLVYNVIAFGLQPFIGYSCDIGKNIPIARIGCCILILGLLLLHFPWVSLFVCAAGNACFHVGGGIDSLVRSNGRMSRSGIFVSTGAIGVALGTLAGKSNSIPAAVPVTLLFVSFILMVFLCGTKSGKPGDVYPRDDRYRPGVHFHNTSPKMSVPFVLVLCFVLIMIRSYTGSIIPAGWRTTAYLVMLPGIGACAGKAAGGFLADRFGARTTGIVSLIASIPLLCFGYKDPFLCTAGILLFNMTMPVTLCAVADKLPGNPGLAFGVTTLGLLCGTVPTFFFALPVGSVIPLIAGLILISVICIRLSMINRKGVKRDEKISQTV